MSRTLCPVSIIGHLVLFASNFQNRLGLGVRRAIYVDLQCSDAGTGKNHVAVDDRGGFWRTPVNQNNAKLVFTCFPAICFIISPFILSFIFSGEGIYTVKHFHSFQLRHNGWGLFHLLVMVIVFFSFYSERGKNFWNTGFPAFINSRIYIFDSAMFNTGENGSANSISRMDVVWNGHF